jgi:adenosylcobyric acid synthase
VGKSIIVAAVCRILNNYGFSVAPFKSQNMSLNSFITEDGKEMGRAQVVQAECARIKPHVTMNPILLKPTSDVGSQVILGGEVFKNMEAKKYFSSKDYLVPYIRESFESLEKAYDIVVIEGAGSPAEINLRSRDIVNMGLAEIIDTDVVLIGDVDKGGVFASLYGTFLLLEKEEQKRIQGFVINKFRGDVSLLLSGVEMLEKLIDRPCLGIIPFIDDLKVDDEDSVTERFSKVNDRKITIGVVKLPYMSNFTDFTVFDLEEDVSLEYMNDAEAILKADLIVIPGSKNTIHDMKYLLDSSLSRAIYEAHRDDIPIIGICGGYQILGQWIEDREGVESAIDKINGLGLLDVLTEMAAVKTTRQAKGRIISDFMSLGLEGESLKGYEIHMGQTKHISDKVLPFMKTDLNEMDGAINLKGNVLGTYYHGIFDNDGFRTTLLQKIKSKKGFSSETTSQLSFEVLKDREYDRLAQHVENHLNMVKIVDILNASREKVKV